LEGWLFHALRFHLPNASEAPARATDLQEKWTIPAHARLGQPRFAYAQKLSRFARRQQTVTIAWFLAQRERLGLFDFSGHPILPQKKGPQTLAASAGGTRVSGRLPVLFDAWFPSAHEIGD
jgi:hypothetical protein